MNMTQETFQGKNNDVVSPTHDTVKEKLINDGYLGDKFNEPESTTNISNSSRRRTIFTSFKNKNEENTTDINKTTERYNSKIDLHQIE